MLGELEHYDNGRSDCFMTVINSLTRQKYKTIRACACACVKRDQLTWYLDLLFLVTSHEFMSFQTFI